MWVNGFDEKINMKKYTVGIPTMKVWWPVYESTLYLAVIILESFEVLNVFFLMSVYLIGNYRLSCSLSGLYE